MMKSSFFTFLTNRFADLSLDYKGFTYKSRIHCEFPVCGVPFGHVTWACLIGGLSRWVLFLLLLWSEAQVKKRSKRKEKERKKRIWLREKKKYVLTTTGFQSSRN